MRQTLSIMAVRTMSPMTGVFKMTLSSQALPELDRRKAMTTPMTEMRPSRRAHHHVLTKCDAVKSMRVGRGSFALKDAKNVTNFGMTNVAKTITTSTAITATTAG